nr:flagellar basal body P-ring formation chaperone FlgA [Desulfobulbus alkaliphilus]
MFLFVLLPCLLITAAPAAARVSVHFQSEAVVTGNRIVLADIAAIVPEAGAEAIGALPVASAPAPGGTRRVHTASVITSLRNRAEVAEVEWMGSESILVHRRGFRVDHDKMGEIIGEYLLENAHRLPRGEIRFTPLRAPEELVLPWGEINWSVTPSRPGIINSTSFSIFFTVDGAPAGNCIISGRLEVIAEVPTAVTTLHRGDLITKDNITMERQVLSRPDRPILDKEEIVGMQMTRTVNAGRVIEEVHITVPPVVKEGEMVKIHARKGSLYISTSGIARDDGGLGEQIRVRNIASNKLIHCRVDGPGMVSVEF